MKPYLKINIPRLLIGLALSLWIGAPALAQSSATGSALALTADQADAIGVDAYIYFYPLILMDLTRKQSTNGTRTEFGKGPMNTFVNVPAYPPADFKGVVRSNFDTLYSIAWLDLTKEPLVVSAPDTDGRYYLLPMLDMWTDVFASPGWRTTGTQAGNFLVTPPGWSGKVPEGFTRIDAPTPYVWIIGRTKTDGPADYDAVHKIQAGYKVTPLSRWGKAPEPVAVKIDPTVDMKTPPMVQVDTMSAGAYFAYAAELLKLHPPHLTDQPIIAQMKRIGIEPGKSFDISTTRSGREARRWRRAGGSPAAHEVEGANHSEGRELLVDEHRHDGRLWELLPEARHRGAAWPGGEPAGGCHLSLESRRRNGQAAGRREPVHDSLREGCHAAGPCILVHHALRRGWLPGRECSESLCREQLDAVQVQRGRLARPLFSERQSGQGQGS